MAYDYTSTWNHWTTSSATTITTAQSTWGYWTTGTCTSTCAEETNGTWHIWSAATHDSLYVWQNWSKTSEQTRAQKAQAEIDRIVRKEADEIKDMAELTAQDLLKDLITEEEMEVYKKTGRLLVKGNKNDYILVKGMQADVIKIDKGKILNLKDYKKKIKGTSYCVHPRNQYALPDTDKIIAMKVAIESEEDKIMGMANARGQKELDLAVGM